MTAKKVCLRAVMTDHEGKRIWAGEYACSICGQRFHPDAKDPVKLTLDFSKHAAQHPATAGKKEESNQGAS